MRGLHRREKLAQKEGLEKEQGDKSENERDRHKRERGGSMMWKMCEGEDQRHKGTAE